MCDVGGLCAYVTWEVVRACNMVVGSCDMGGKDMQCGGVAVHVCDGRENKGESLDIKGSVHS